MVESILLPLAVALIIFAAAFIVLNVIGNYLKQLGKFFWYRVITPDINKSHWPRVISPTESNIRKEIAWAGIRKLPSVALVILLAAAFIFLSIYYGSILLFALVIAISLVSAITVSQQAKAKKKKFISQLPDSLLALSQSLKAGYSLPEALKIVERESQQPVSNIYKSLVRADEYRVTFPDALTVLQTELNVPEWDLIAETLFVQAKIGGNIIPVIEDIAVTLRDKVKVEQELSTNTATGRASGIIIALMAPISIIALMFVAPDYIGIMFTTTIGKILLALAVILEALGFAFILKVMKVEF